MYVCKNCGQTYASYTTICSKCGNAVVAAPNSSYSSSQQTQYVAPQPQYAAYSAPTTPVYPYSASSVPAPSGGIRAMGIIGFILALETLFSIFYALIAGESYSYYGGYYYDNDVMAGVFFVHLLFAVTGLVFSCISRNKGFGGLSVAGKVISIISLVLNTLFFFIALGEGF